MRTAIFVSALIIALSINQGMEKEIDNVPMYLLIGIFCIFDMAELFKK